MAQRAETATRQPTGHLRSAVRCPLTSTGDKVHTARLLVRTSATRAYTVSWLTKDFDWQINAAYLPIIRQSFRPATGHPPLWTVRVIALSAAL
jgi:hypothetical protein